VEDMMTLVEELNKMTVFELKSYAKKRGIDLFGVKTKAEFLEVILNFVPKEEPKAEITEEGAHSELEVVLADRNLYWSGVGKLKEGYNLVSKQDAEKWLRVKSVSSATASDLARSYGV
jgi:predicted S18 family serine protease